MESAHSSRANRRLPESYESAQAPAADSVRPSPPGSRADVRPLRGSGGNARRIEELAQTAARMRRLKASSGEPPSKKSLLERGARLCASVSLTLLCGSLCSACRSHGCRVLRSRAWDSSGRRCRCADNGVPERGWVHAPRHARGGHSRQQT